MPFRRLTALGAVFCPLMALLPSAVCRADKNLTPSPSAVSTGIVEDTDEDWTWTGMLSVSGPEYHGGSARAGAPLTRGVYVFTGTGVKVFGIHTATIAANGSSHAAGKMSINIDGKRKAIVDLSKPLADPGAAVYEVGGLPSANHVLQVDVIEGWGAVDYITVLTGSADGASPSALPDGKDYRITSKLAPDKWLDSETDTDADGSALNIYALSRPNHSQVWVVVPIGGGFFRISPKDKPDQAVTLMTRKARVNGTDYDLCGLYKYSGADAQKWAIVPSEAGYCKISNAYDRRCLNVAENLTSDGTPIIAWQWQDTTQNNDQWRFVPAK